MSEDERLDRWRDRMVAALYGELPLDERQELEQALAEDETLRRDWEELQEARAALQQLTRAGETAVPVADAPSGPWAVARVTHVRRRWLVPAGAGFAAAAVLFAGLLLAGLRVDHTPAGLLVRLDGSPAAELEAAGAATGSLAGQGVTRAELATVAQALLDGTAARLDQLERRQTGAQVELTQALYDALAQRQERQFDDLRSRIELTRARWPAPGEHGASATGKGVHDERN